MSAFAVVVGLGAGLSAAVAHLAVRRWRAGLALRRGPAAVLLTLPIAFAGPIAAVLLAARAAPQAAWLVPIGLLLGRSLFFGAVRRHA